MLLNSNVLGQMLEDAILCYEMTAGRVHPKRQAQIAQIRRMCEGSNFDAMIESFVRQLCQRIQRDQSYIEWFMAKASRLSMILSEALEKYHAHKLSLVCSPSIQKVPTIDDVKSISWDQVKNRRDQLLGSDVLALTNG